MSLPTEDRSYGTKKDMEHEIQHLLGGRVAEALTLDDISTGASNDIQRATETARDMVTKYGFSSKIGPVNYSDSSDVFLGRDYSKTKSYSEGVAMEIDTEVRRIIEEAYSMTEKILQENMDKLERVAQALMRVETLDGEQFEALYTGKVTAEELEQQVMEKEAEIRRQNAREAEESERLRREEEARLAAELARYDTDYLNDDDEPDEPEVQSTPAQSEPVSEPEVQSTPAQSEPASEPEAESPEQDAPGAQDAPRRIEENNPEGENSADEKEGEQL